MCEPGFKVGLKEMCYTSPLFLRLTIHLVSPSDITSWILTRPSVTCVDDTNVQALDCLATAYQRSYNLGYSPLEGVLSTGHRTHISSKEALQRYDKEGTQGLQHCSQVSDCYGWNAWRRFTIHHKTESGTHLESGIHQQEFRIQYVKSGTYIMESKIQYCLGTPCMRQTTRQQHRSNTLAI